jgi:peptidoglycan/xylan/chitin deacetylase (PgdA/CDA1 family)
MRGSDRVRKTTRSLWSRFKPGAAILMYHRVTTLEADPYRLTVSPAHFAQQMRILAETCVPMHLEDLIDAMLANALPRRAVAVTFDDGYLDNLTEAYPILERTGVPATVFVVSGRMGSPLEFWWDDLERMLMGEERTPEDLQLTIGGEEYCWPTRTAEQRTAARTALHGMLSRQTAKHRQAALDALLAWSGKGAEGRPTHRAMSVGELLRLAESGLVRIGGHTVTHAVLSTLSAEDQRYEIETGCRELEDVLGKPVRTFAYPYGRAVDWTSDTARLAREAGLRGAVSTVPGSVEAGCDPYRLPRWAAPDCDGASFARALESFFVL